MKQEQPQQDSPAGLDKRIAGLSPEKRALLYKRMAGVDNDSARAAAPDTRSGARGIASPGFAPQSIRKRSPGKTLPLSFAQQRLWFLDRLLPDKATYNIPMAWRLRGPLDVPALQRSLQALLVRHESLRTRFSLGAAEPEQCIDAAHDLGLASSNLSALQADEREARMLEIVIQAARAPFDLEAGPLLRAHLLRLGAEEHVLLVNIHHIAFDGWSMGVFNRELSIAYGAFARGVNPQLPELPIQYADYAIWQREWLQGEELKGQLAYWKHKLTALTTLELPTDRVRPAVQSYRGARIAFELPLQLTQALKALGLREGVTFFMTLLAAFKVLLYRYSGQEDIVVGTPIAARRRTELEGLIGFFANTLVLRTELTGNPSFRELLARVRETALGAYTHQDLPFEKLVEELAPARDLSRDPLFQAMFVLQNAPGEQLELHGVRASRVQLESNTAKFDLMISLRETAQGLSASWEYAADLFDAATIERMAANFQVLLEGIVADPSAPIAELPILSPAEREQLLLHWNNTTSAYPSSACIHQLFEVQALRNPQAVALIDCDQQLSYAELNARANRLAHQLIAMGVGPEVLVAVCLERSIELVVALLAILKAGGAYVPLDPAYPNERLAFMLEDTNAAVLIAEQALLERLPNYSGKLLCIDREQRLYNLQPDLNPDARCHPEQLAYVIYTSGSTGKPKGILLRHTTLVNLITCHGQETASGRVAQFTPVSFDVSLQEILHALLHAKTLVVVDAETRMRPEKLAAFLQQYEITDLFAPNVVLEYLAHAVVETKLDLPALENVYQAGEALTITSTMQAFFAHHPGLRLHNHYGPAESHVVTATTLPPDPHAWPYRPVIGTPIANTRIYILDGHQQPVPIGVPGEIYVGGAGLARGYLNRDALTRERFLPDPFAETPDQRIYRSGDLARYLPDGNIEYLGRIDDQLKIRGFRIEPGEIETVLAGHPSVRQAVVIAREDTPGDKRLVAYVVAPDRCSIDIEALRALTRERLPEYMRPGAYVALEALPLTANGKVDRAALPAPHYTRDDSARTFVPARNALEEIVAEVWREILRLEQVSMHDNFFELGGHSLLAAQIVARLGKLLRVELPLRHLFETPTVSALAEHVGRLLGTGKTHAVEPIDRARRDDFAPLSFAQQRLWFLDRLLPDKSVYNIPMAWRLHGQLDVAALQRSLQALLVRHESLRTRFSLRADEPQQRIDPAHEAALTLTDLGHLDANEREARMLEIVIQAAREPFDLEAGPLLRALLLRLDAEAHVLLVNIHHIAFDGWSMGVFNRELSIAYAAFAQGVNPQLPDLPIQYADYAIWQEQWLQGEEPKSQLAYWKHKLNALTTLELPTDRPRPPVQSYRGARIGCELPARLSEALKALGRREGATLFMTVLAAFKVLLYRYSGQEDIAVGTPIAARRRTELEGLIGFFANTLVLRTELTGNPSFRELLARVRETALGAYTHQDLPFEKLVEELAPARDLSRDPLFQAMFVLQNMPGAALALDHLHVSALALQGNTAKFDLMIALRETPEGLHASWEYAADLFDAATIERMAANFRVLLEGIVADPSAPIAELPILSPAEREQLLLHWNNTTSAFPSSACIHQLFEVQALRNPQAVALIDCDQQLSYAELNARANRLAHQLIAMGVGPEVLVAVCLERSIELVVALLAILKAGGAYVPLDPAYPNERLAFMLADTKAAVLISEPALKQRLPSHSAKLLCLDRDQGLDAAQPDTNPQTPCHPEQLAYVIYTSGSTGKPKGILLPHATLVNLIACNGHEPPGGRVAQFTPVSFDVSLQEILHALLHAKTVVVVDVETRMRPEKLAAFLQQYAITDLFAPNVVLEYLAHAVLEAKVELPALENVYQAGEALTITPAVQAFFDRHRGSRLHNHYGPAESHVVTAATLPADPHAWPYRPVIGTPIANTRIYILDRHRQPVPIGVPGELYVGGAGLARGYLNQDALTGERFLPDPFAATPGERIYRSGDLARYLPDGNIEYLGRIDEQLKIRGFRIEPGEIETVLAEHPALRQAVVIAREDTPGDKRLVAYLVAADRGAIDIEALRALTRERLPEYMRPGAYVVLEALPLTANGKIDRRALPALSEPSANKAPHDTAPRDKIERTLCAVWAETLEREHVGLDDNFFQIGGHSLLAAKLFARLDRLLDRTLPLATLFESPTIRELACFYRGGKEPSVRSALVPICTAGGAPPLFAVPGVGGNVVGFADLARELGSAQPFFGLQSIGLDGQRDPLENIERMASEYLREVREEQPRGPYYLLGACFGSAVAFEMARQLIDAGELVGLLALADPSLLNANGMHRSTIRMPAGLERGLALTRFVAQRFRLYREGMRVLGFKERIKFSFDKARLLVEAIQTRDLFRGDRREFHQRRVADINLRAMLQHTHRRLNGGAHAVEIFASEQRYDRLTVDSRLTWNTLAGRSVVYHRMRGRDSGDMIQGRNATGFAELLSRRLQQAREEIAHTRGNAMVTASTAASAQQRCRLHGGTP